MIYCKVCDQSYGSDCIVISNTTDGTYHLCPSCGADVYDIPEHETAHDLFPECSDANGCYFGFRGRCIMNGECYSLADVGL